MYESYMPNFYSLLFILFSIWIPVSTSAQEVTIKTTISSDSILAGNTITLSYEVDGGNISKVVAPDLSAFQILSGPNVSSSFRMINGEVSQKASYTYILQAITIGDQTIEAALISVGEDIHEAEILHIHVLENPDAEIMDKLNQNEIGKKKPKKKRKTYKI